MRLQRVRHNLVSEQQQTREHPHDGVLCSYEKDAIELDTLMHKEETFPKEDIQLTYKYTVKNQVLYSEYKLKKEKDELMARLFTCKLGNSKL